MNVCSLGAEASGAFLTDVHSCSTTCRRSWDLADRHADVVVAGREVMGQGVCQAFSRSAWRAQTPWKSCTSVSMVVATRTRE